MTSQSDIDRILANARELDPDERWEARFRIWAPGCSSTAVSMQCCLGMPIPPLSGWTVADKLEFKIAKTGLKSEQAAVMLAREMWVQWVETQQGSATGLREAWRATVRAAVLHGQFAGTTEGGWECPGSPTRHCVYHPATDPGRCDSCLFCGEPDERK